MWEWIRFCCLRNKSDSTFNLIFNECITYLSLHKSTHVLIHGLKLIVEKIITHQTIIELDISGIVTDNLNKNVLSNEM